MYIIVRKIIMVSKSLVLSITINLMICLWSFIIDIETPISKWFNEEIILLEVVGKLVNVTLEKHLRGCFSRVIFTNLET